MGIIRRGQRKYRPKRWVVFLVRDNGKTVPLQHVKGMVLAVIFFGTALMVLIGALVFLHMDLLDKNKALEGMTADQAHAIAAVQKEKDSLMAQLAIAESKLKISQADVEGTQRAGEESATGVETDSVKASLRTVAAANAAETTETPQTEASRNHEAEMPAADAKNDLLKISVDNLLVCYDPDSGRMQVEFKVINIGEKKTAGFRLCLYDLKRRDG